MDFFEIRERALKNGVLEIYPDFIMKRSKDLMIRGRSFYAIYVPETGMWSTDEYEVQRLVDKALMDAYEERRKTFAGNLTVRRMSSFTSSAWKDYKSYVSQSPDRYVQLDTKILFADEEVKREDYVSRKLPYALSDTPCPAYEEIVSTLYDKEERDKFEWAIGAILCGDAKNIQKFLVFFGDPGSGKSTILDIMQALFQGFYISFKAKDLVTGSNAFGTEQLKSNPLIAIQHDGDLSKIEDNSTLNSIVSHEEIIVNEKFKSAYPMKANCFLMMATNKPVKITDARAGLIRRLIDIKPSKRQIPFDRYNELKAQVQFELGSIAKSCLDKYRKMGKSYYNNYRPIDMMYKTDPFFNFVESSYDLFEKEDGTSLKAAYILYKQYCEASQLNTMPMYKFREELKDYFKHFDDVARVDGVQIRSYYRGFISKKFKKAIEEKEAKLEETWLNLYPQTSILDREYSECPAQYGTSRETPSRKWAEVTTKLHDLDTSQLHYVQIPESHIVIDFDIKDSEGHKSLELNLEEARNWPRTYAETSKSGNGLHLHYIYSGDTAQLARVMPENSNIEIKVYTGNGSLRRKLVKCNNLPIATISSGLPLKEKRGDKMVNFDSVQSEKGLRALISKSLRKEVHPATKPSMDFIFKIMEDAYNSGLKYDVTDMRPSIMAFAANSSHQAEYCLELFGKMKFKSEEPSVNDESYDDDYLIFYDIEVFPNLFLVNWKREGDDHKVVRMINPTAVEIEALCKHKLVGFNCRRYDNHIMYAAMLGYSNAQLYDLSQRIINGSANAFFGEAYNLSYTDVYDFSSKKQSLKKFEIELGIHHQELGLPWDKPVPEDMWYKVAEYCDNDVIATEATFNARKADFIARQILADVAGMSVNDTTNSLTTRIIFGKDRKPQSQFNYRDMGNVPADHSKLYMLGENGLPQSLPKNSSDIYNIFDLGTGKPYFPGYTFEGGKSRYRGEEVGEGGYVYAEPGMYGRTVTFDVASMHPSSVIAENLFGDEYTKRFKDILDARIAIKHKDFNKAKTMLNGALARHLENEDDAKALAQALKIAINSVYGLTSAKFENPFKDPRNKDNIVAKRGELFMINLKHEVQKRGFRVIHIKTDSIKIENPSQDIVDFVMEFGSQYGYNFEIEHIFEKICLVNDAVYIAKLAEDDPDNPGEWTATGTQFQIPYIFKTLFSHEELVFEDFCETKTVNSALYLDMNENLDNGHDYHFVGKAGQFCPIKSGCGGGELLRETTDKDGNQKFAAATGTKGFRWLESEVVKANGKDGDIDEEYYVKLAQEAINDISKFGDFDKFVGKPSV